MDSSKSSTLKPPTTNYQRLPAPSLFVGPPSRNASNPSVSLPPPPPAKPLTNQSKAASKTAPKLRRPTNAQIDAHWADLQSTLSDIELSAANSTHVFGPSHAAALDELRRAQIELARAWGPQPNHDDTDGDQPANEDKMHQGGGDNNNSNSNNKKDGKRAANNGGPRPRSPAASMEKASLHSATSISKQAHEDRKVSDADLSAAAAARRTANEAYFARVKSGVQDVVAKLEEVSGAMRAVEMESREIWGEGESLASVPTRASG
ncbi:hypothetical protein H2203_008429 [Taxawa tesnikishii (nom. ined.)]|nr:hypothetical protein H2203_008429 [Dothideales sp. JES 119]